MFDRLRHWAATRERGATYNPECAPDFETAGYVSITRETARLALAAIARQNATDAYSNYLHAEGELTIALAASNGEDGR